MKKWCNLIVGNLLLVLLASCGGGGGATSFNLSGTVTGLNTSAQVTLLNNSSSTLVVSANGAFQFTTPVTYNGTYAVTVGSQPIGQVCTIENGTGSGVITNVNNIVVNCSSLPTLSVSAQTQIDDLIKSFMGANSINAGSFTVMNGGYVLYSKSYGYQNDARTTATVTDPMMVTASIVKPLTAAAIQKLALSGAIRLSDHVFCTGSNQPCWLNVTNPNGVTISGTSGSGTNFKGANYANITIQQLINHEGGWDRGALNCAGASNFRIIGGLTNPTPCDPMIQEYLIQQTLHTMFPSSFSSTQLPSQMNDIYYWVTQNALDFAPGTKQVYSNFGYMLLSAIVAQASASDFTVYAYNDILKPLGIDAADFTTFSFSPASNSSQALRTPALQTNQSCVSIYPSNNGGLVAGTLQGCLNPVNWVGAATILTTAKTMATFAGAYLIDNTSNLDALNHPSLDGSDNGKPLAGSFNSGVHYGDLPGVTNIIRQLSTGTSYTLMMSRDSLPSGTWQQTLYPKIDAIISSAKY